MLSTEILNKKIPSPASLVSILKRRKKKTSRKELLKKSFDFNFGEQDQIDLISYSGLEENSSYLQVGVDLFDVVRDVYIVIKVNKHI
jgi:hypothetical protein